MRNTLSPTQQRVADMLCLGKRARNIALELGCSTQTVKNHIGEVYARTGAKNRFDYVINIRQAGKRDLAAAA